MKSIEDVIKFNQRHAARELRLFGQETLIEAAAKGPLTDAAYLEANAKCGKYAASLNASMDEHRLDAFIAPTTGPAGVLDFINGDRGLGGSSSYSAIAGWPIITVPCGEVSGLPVGLSFFGRAWSEPTLVNIALAFEQATKARRAPRFLPTLGFPETMS
jgi:amidase